MDFISYHGYFVWDETGRNRLFFKDNPSRVLGQREAIDKMLHERGLNESLPVFVSEMGIYPGPLADDYNSMDDDRVRQAVGMLSLFYWYGKSKYIYPFNWVIRHHLVVMFAAGLMILFALSAFVVMVRKIYIEKQGKTRRKK